MNMESQVLQVNLDDIIPNRFQPRLAFDEQGIKELASSIKEHGIIQPLVLRKLGNKYEIIAGERRYKAATLAGLTTVPAVISNIDDNKSAEVALVENIQRRDLTPIEEAKSYKNLLDKGYLTQEQLAKKMGISQPAIANKLRLLNLDEEVQQALLENKISERHARSLLVLNSKEEQKIWLERILRERMTVRQLDQELKKYLNNNSTGSDIPLVNLTPDINQIQSHAIDLNFKSQSKEVPSMNIEPEILDFNSTSSINQQPVQETSIPSADQPINKFFNILEDSPVNMNNSIFNNDFSFDQTNANSNNGIEIFDENQKSQSLEQNQTSNNVTSLKEEPETFNFSSDNRFFTPINDQAKNDEPVKKEENVLDPMSLIEDYQDPTLPTTDSTANIEKIKDIINELKNQGINISYSESELGNIHQIIINIAK